MTDMVKTRAKMMLIAVLLAVVSAPAAADDAMWTWVSGVNNSNPPDSAIAPGGREGGISWIDSDRNLWLFGGDGIGMNSASSGLLNGVWKFDEAVWAWLKGSDAVTDKSYQVGVYGTKGSSGAGNTPGARTNSVSWTGTGSDSGYLYLFGGYGYDVNGTLGLLNDLWKFSLSGSSYNWTWVSGSSTVGQYGVYGTMRVAASGNTPGARGWSSAWTDSNGTFWLFGGFGFGESGSAGTLNDLWKYSGSKWTWVSGSKSISRKGVYGTKGVANANNMPGTRYGSVLWMDTKGNLWLYGGKGYDSKGAGGYLCDSWKFDVNTNEWTWDSGSNLANRHLAGVYGTQGQSAADTVPGDREAFASWRDNYGYLWLFGGIGSDASGAKGRLNDLWKFNGSVWEWVSGSKTRSQAGTYGTKGTADLENTPGARSYSVSCIDTNDNLWLFGGSGYDQVGSDGNLNDLWKFGSITPEGVQLRVFCEANEITSDQNTAFVLGTAPVQLAGPSKTFTIRNNGSKTLVFDANFAEPNHFILTQPQESTLAPGEYTTFTITLDTNEIGVFEGTISFDNNDINNNPFSFPVKGTVTRWEFGNIPGNAKNTKLTVPDVCSVSVTFGLTGGGHGEIVGDSNFSEVVLYDTGEKSLLTITTKTEISVGDINSDGPLKSITAKTTNLRGNINVSGSLASLIINDVDDSNDHTVTVGSSSNPKAALSLGFDRVANLTINSQMPVKTISATEWLGGEIDAPSIGTITTKGDKKRSIAGDLDVNATVDASVSSIKTAGTLSGEWNCNAIKSVSALNITSAKLVLNQAPDAKLLALGALTAKRHITDSNIISGGNIGSISAGAMINSLCFAGIKDGVTGLPDPAVDIDVTASIKSIAVKGIKGEPNSFINSDIAAANILSATLNYPQENNGGIPFGVSAGFIKSVKIKDTTWSKALKSLDGPADNNDFGDLKIRLD
jgi:N-acetylneuraminic acid mutarotase